MIEEQEQVDESGVASEAEEGAALVPNQDEDSSPESAEDLQQEDLQQEDSLADSGDAEEFAEWADEDDLAELAKEQAERAGDHGQVDDIAPVEENLDVGPVESRVEERPLDWYILKVQSNREDSIAAGLQRRVKMAGLDDFFQEIIVPVEMVTEFKGGKKKVVKKKLYPGYIVVHMIINDETWFLVRETPGIGDFTGAAGQPTPMLPSEVARIIPEEDDEETQEPKLQIGVALGDRVKINEGTFENFEGDVDTIDEMNGRVTVMINIFGRSTPVELEHWQIEKL
ncbi:MAG: transcription termination/antitermination protein NusG [Planctomycetota bacterium]|nr:transcription termination/antitermination protein NusG [Planctomycetota bacterium]MEC8336924.1 transcription termination/antitermination protein NusG [Planctomycetota bacterium]